MAVKNVNTDTGEIKGVSFKREARVTYPLLKQVEGKSIFVLFTSQFAKSEDKTESKEGEAKKEPAVVAKVVNLETDSLAEIILTAVTVAKLNEHFPDHSYVGKAFEIHMEAKVPGKKYRNVEIFKLAIPEDYQIPTL